MSRLKCERRNGYLVCYPRRRNKTESIVGGIMISLGIAVAIIMTISLFESNQKTFWVPQPAAEATSQPAMQTTKTRSQMPETENEASKLQAVEYLNRIRGKEGIPPVQLIDLSVVKFRAEYLARTNLFSHYDAEGRHPVYWYTRFDGGLYRVEENLFMVYTVGRGRPSARITKINYSDAIYNLVYDDASSDWGHRDSLLDPCHNYVAMATSYFQNNTYAARYYVVYMVAKWVEWISPPRYEGGRFTAEGYAAPAMKPEFFAVYYASYESDPASRDSYDVGDLYLCKVLDTPFARCKDAQEPTGVFTVEKTQDGRWRIKIDASVALDRPGLYTFMIIAEDLRGIKWKPMSPWGHARVGKCRIMGYTVAK